MLTDLLIFLALAPWIYFISAVIYFWIKEQISPEFRLFREIQRLNRRQLKEFKRDIKGMSRAEALSFLIENQKVYAEKKKELIRKAALKDDN